MDENGTSNGSSGELPDDIQRWTAKRQAALIGGLAGTMPEDPRDHSRLGDERRDAHRPATARADQGIDVIDAADGLTTADEGHAGPGRSAR